MSQDVYIYSSARSAIGKFGGSLSTMPPGELGAHIASAALDRCGDIDTVKDLVGEVIVGNVLGAGHGMNIGRQVGIKSGLPVTVPAYTVNKVCGSGLKSVCLGYQGITLGEHAAILCGGVENMSLAAHAVHGSRWGTKLGAPNIVDLLLNDGLTDHFEGCHMGITAENLAEEMSISREMQDDYAFSSQKKTAAAIADGQFAKEIAPIEIFHRGKSQMTFQEDEHPRSDITRESLTALKPAFTKNGSVTAGSASGINDGAAFVVLGNRTVGESLGLAPRFRIRGISSSGIEPRIMGLGPVNAVESLLKKCSLKLSDIGLFELNEAFAAQAIAVSRALEVDESLVNIRGGAIALGHPIGASGARILVTLLSAMEDVKAPLGIAALCVGGGQGVAIAVEQIQ
ncbi:acetyl-CoA C-acyltransferase [bacterium]|nr:acetyl-CoA C-acyltransferase [bacterium]